MSEPRIIVSLDFDASGDALELLGKLRPELCRIKVGKELFTVAGPELVKRIIGHGFDVFLDLKFHDIPATVACACAAAAKLGIWMLNVHISGGREMMLRARETLERQKPRPLLIGVTLLTSLEQNALDELGCSRPVAEQVLHMARLARDAGLDGVVCSAREARAIRRALGDDFLLVTPGIRRTGQARQDQRRVSTPAEALRAGSDYLVIGRPITRAQDPLQALRDLIGETEAEDSPTPRSLGGNAEPG